MAANVPQSRRRCPDCGATALVNVQGLSHCPECQWTS